MHGTFVTVNDRLFLVQRHLTDAVDSVVGVVGHIRHTVLSTLHHHAAAEDTAEVGTLDAVHQTACIDGQYTALLPVAGIRIGLPFLGYRVLYKDGLASIYERHLVA